MVRAGRSLAELLESSSHPPRLAAGIELLGAFDGSGHAEALYLIRRSDGRMVEVSGVLYALAAAVDGKRDLDDIAAAVTTTAGRHVSAANVANLIAEKLAPLGVVESHSGPALRRATVHRPLGLAVRSAVIPRAVVGAFAAALRPLFLPPVVAAALVSLMTVDTWMLVSHGWGRGLEDLAREPALLLVVVGLTLLAGGFHELGHATAARYGGAEPGVIGVGIYLIWPVFYNDLNDSYRLSRGGRLRADLGGVYFNVLVILMLACAYAVTGFEVLVVVIAVQHVAILQQFLPFVRLDGYYVVSDLAGVPDLFGRIRPILKSGLPGRRPDPLVDDLQPRARALVTAWVAVTVPLLVACGALLIARAPDLMRLAASWRTGTPVSAALSVLQLLMLAIPLIGLTMALVGLAQRSARAASRRQDLGSPAYVVCPSGQVITVRQH